MILWLIVWQMQAAAQTPISAESMQLRILINKSEEQIRALNEMVKYGQRDSDSLEKASKILNELHAGMDRSIEKYQGTKTYQKALMKLQSQDDFKRTYSDAAEQRQRRSQPADLNQIEFQKQSVLANQEDLAKLEDLERTLKSAEQGLVPKIQAQAQIGSWQANARVSAQMTELLSSIQAMREEMRGRQESSADPLSLLLKGTEALSNKQSEMRRP